MLLFVYGSLRKSMVNDISRTMKKFNPEFVGYATAKGRLYGANGTWFPFAKFDEDVETTVVGEVYKLEDAAVVHLDYIEGSPVLFARTLITATFKDGSSTDVTAYSYQQPSDTLLPIEHGDWKIYRGQGNGD